ncbi:hypothetical protein GW932_03725 [archaeon]|nr:hypothetical protein [archaeon]
MKKIFSLFFILLISFTIIQNVSSLSVVVYVPEKYTDVNAGDRFYFQIEVKYPENPRRKDLRLEYEIKDLDGNLVSQSKALKAVETQASFIDFLVIPESVKSGLYTINIKIEDYEGLSEEVSASFNVVGKQTDQMKLYLFILVGVVIFLGILVVIQLFHGGKKR